jgi:predicted small lipoprotein YifL
LSPSPRSRAALLAAVALVSLCACGRRGELEPPPSPDAVQTPANNHNLELHRTSRTITPPDKDFVLDPLLK